MAFLPLTQDEGKVVLLKAKASISFTKGDALVDDGAGYITTASAGGNVDIRYVAAETITSASTDGATLIKAWQTDGTRFVADTDLAPAQTDVGTEADLAAAGQVDPDASTDDVFYIESILGAAADKKVIGHFTRGVPNS